MSVFMETRKNREGRVTSAKWVCEHTRDGKRYKARFDTQAEARAAEGRWLRGHLPEEATREARPFTLLAALELFAPQLWSKPAYRDTCCYAVRQWASLLGGDPRLEEITTAKLDAAKVRFQQARGISAHSVRKYMSSLSKVLQKAETRGLLRQAPRMPWPEGVVVRKRRDLTLEEEARFVEHLQAKAWGCPTVAEVLDYMTVALGTGMRRGELLGLTRGHLQGDTLMLRDTKQGEWHSVVLTPEIQTILERRLPWRITTHQLRYHWNETKRALGLSQDRRLTPHSMRHSAATRLLEAETDIAVVSNFLGHSRLATTSETYAHITRQTKRAAAEKLAGINAKARNKERVS
jgi:integrase